MRPKNFSLSSSGGEGGERRPLETYLCYNTLGPNPPCWFNMNQHVPDVTNLIAHAVLHVMGNFMGMLDSHLRIHLDMHIHVVVVAHLAHEAFFYRLNAGHALGHSSDPFNHLAAGGAV